MALRLIFALLLAVIPARAQMTLSWAASTSAATDPKLTYNIYRAPGTCPSVGVPTNLVLVGNSKTTTFTDKDVKLTGMQTYCYAVRALSGNGIESDYSNTAQASLPIYRGGIKGATNRAIH